MAGRSTRYRGGSGGGGGTAAPTFTAPEQVQTADKPVLTLTPTDRANVAEVPAFTLTPLDAVQLGDALPTLSLTATPPDTVQPTDVLSTSVDFPAVTRSGTPDTDSWGDGWTDALLANQGVNHGNETPLKVAQVTAITEQRAYMEFDCTRFTGWTATGGTFVFSDSQDSPALTVVLTVSFGAQAGRPFTESTLAQSNQPAVPTGFTRTFTLAANTGTAGTADRQTITLTAGEAQSLIGKWGLVTFQIPVGSLMTAYVASREDATAGNRPKLTLNLTR